MGIKGSIDMSRPTRVHIDATALLHNLRRVKQCAPGKQIVAMVKANAYGCGLSEVLPVLEGQVDAFGVACIEEAVAIRQWGSVSECILFQGVFSREELPIMADNNLQCVIHHQEQLDWICSTKLSKKIKVWVKVNTGMHRLGFFPQEVNEVIHRLLSCSWVHDEIGLMTHLASADEPECPTNQEQLLCFNQLSFSNIKLVRSIANSAAIMALPETHEDVVRPGIMLYGVSPFSNQVGADLGLVPVMRLMSAISAIHHYPAHARIGYGGTWQSDRPTIIGVVAVGYGDGYPRHIQANTPTWVNGHIAPVVGRVSMDMLTIDLTHCPGIKVGDAVELWGRHIPVEVVARSAGTIAYELLCQMAPRVRGYG